MTLMSASPAAETTQRTKRDADIGGHSPCIGVCDLDPATGWCVGCARTGDEIQAWRDADPAMRRTIWDRLPARLSQLGAQRRILPWSPDGCLDAAMAMTRARRGAWLIKAEQGSDCAWFPTAPEFKLDLKRASGLVDVSSDFGRFWLAGHEKLRAFAFGPVEAPTAFVFTLPQGRIAFPPRQISAGAPVTEDMPSAAMALETVVCQIAMASGTQPHPRPELPPIELPSWAGIVATFVAASSVVPMHR